MSISIHNSNFKAFIVLSISPFQGSKIKILFHCSHNFLALLTKSAPLFSITSTGNVLPFTFVTGISFDNSLNFEISKSK